MNHHAWGTDDTQFFYELTPDRILQAVESAGYMCTGRLSALNSMENRVYEVEIELPQKSSNPSDHFLVAKFYRPGRWNEKQILDEHAFLLKLQKEEISVLAPLPFDEGITLKKLPEVNIFFALFPKKGGRPTDEMNDENVKILGRLIARVHGVGSTQEASHRLVLTPSTYGDHNLEYLLNNNKVPEKYENLYQDLVEDICDIAEPWFEDASYQRIHGDCHLANILWRPEGPLLLDFDDMVMGPPVQDIWLVTPGRDAESLRQRQVLLEAYEELREFDRSTLKLIEPLRALRFVHFSAWMAKRWEDPAFPRAFPHFGTEKYWQEQIADLKEQLTLLKPS